MRGQNQQIVDPGYSEPKETAVVDGSRSNVAGPPRSRDSNREGTRVASQALATQNDTSADVKKKTITVVSTKETTNIRTNGTVERLVEKININEPHQIRASSPTTGLGRLSLKSIPLERRVYGNETRAELRKMLTIAHDKINRNSYKLAVYDRRIKRLSDEVAIRQQKCTRQSDLDFDKKRVELEVNIHIADAETRRLSCKRAYTEQKNGQQPVGTCASKKEKADLRKMLDIA